MRTNYLYFTFLCLVLLTNCNKTVQPLADELNQQKPLLPNKVLKYNEAIIPETILKHRSVTELAISLNLVSEDTSQHTNQSLVGEHLGFFPTRSKDIPKITNAGATLGRVLFYDSKLSLNSLISCGSCHLQEKAFSDPRKTSLGFEGIHTTRNSMGIVNVGLNQNMFWDSRTPTVKTLVLRPVQDHIEMGMESLEYLEVKLARQDYYADLFEAAYMSPVITAEKIADALAQFLCSMTSFQSKFDVGNEDWFANFTAAEKRGKNIFFHNKAQCASCHALPNFAAPDFPGGAYGSPAVAGTANIGLDVHYQDQGKGQGKFRIPSLRNIGVTAPYMHDGRFNTLMEVIEHYDHGVKSHSALDKKLLGPNGLPQRLKLTQEDKEALLAFLHTLTDQSFLDDDKFSDPFN